MKGSRLIWCGMVWAAAWPGCSDMEDGPTQRSAPSRWNRIALPTAQPDQAFDAAIDAVRQYFTVFDASRSDLRIVTPMVEYSQRGGTERILDSTLRPNNRMRRRATVLITPSGNGCIALCEVSVQRLDTADQRTFQQHREFNDLPNATPIERDAGVSASQAEAWTDMPRDSRLEREILQIIFNRVSPPKDAGTKTPENP